MVGPKLFRDATRRLELVEILSIAEADGERLNRTRHLFRHQRDIRRRIDAARQKHAERHVRHHSLANRVAQQTQDLRALFLFSAGDRLFRRKRVPVTLDVERAVARQRQHVTGGSLCMSRKSVVGAGVVRKVR